MHANLDPQIVAVILAGGQAKRLNGVEKGLQKLGEKTLISHILTTLSPQISTIWLNINRKIEQYQNQFPTLPYYRDELADFQGPLSGMLSAFEQIESDHILFVPCDTPFLPPNLVSKLATVLRINQATIAYAHDGERPHPTIALIHRSAAPALRAYLQTGERRVWQFFQGQRSVAVDFSEQKTAFQNFNTPADFANFQPKNTACSPKLLAITGYSGTGKTTLLEKLIPFLTQQGVKIGLIKHSHHNVDIDHQGKDSYRLRLAGANPTMVVCNERWALMSETATPLNFSDCVAKFAHSVDLILVEGFKHETLPKIQLHRQNFAKPLPELDEFTLAVATDYPLDIAQHLDLNNIAQIGQFILDWLKKA